MKKLLIAAAAVSIAALSAPAYAADAPTIPIIVKDTTSFYWQIVLAGARKAGKDLGVNVPELGAQSESDINGQISILENAVSGKPAAIVISPTQFAALGKPIDEAAKQVKIIGIDSSADSKAFTSFLTTDNTQGGRIAADGLADAIKAKYGKAEGDVARRSVSPLHALGDVSGPAARYDRWTAVYDLAAHTVYLPDGTRLAAHSGLGDRLDDPAHVSERNRGATPPHLYELKARDELFHGVQALRLDPVGGGDIFGRAGFLAHTYMLGPNGDSNGCVSFKDYEAFLRAFQSGEVKRLAVVARID